MKPNVSKRAVTVGTLIFPILVMLGCYRTEAIAPPQAEARGSLGWPPSQTTARDRVGVDERAYLAALVAERLELDRRLSGRPIHLAFDGATLVLLGVVSSDVERSLAGRIALDTSGVASIENHLSVIGDETASPVGTQTRADGAIEDDAVRTIALSRRLGPESVRVVVQRGVATLSGIVENDGDRIFASELVTGISGVRWVRNGLVVQSDR